MKHVLLIGILMFSLSVFTQSKKSNYTLYISEVSPYNTKSHIDRNGNFEDWIEIYNYGNKAIDLEGLYLSDNEFKLKKYQIPADKDPKNLIIYPKSFKIIKCDGNKKRGALHTNFKLKGTGEFIALTAPNGNDIIDSLSFPRVLPNQTYGPISKGKTRVFFAKPTPYKKNASGSTLSPRLAKYQKPEYIKEHKVPVVDIEMDTALFNSKIYGLYHKSNIKKKWKRDAYIRFYDEQDKLRFQTPVDLKLHGAFSKFLPQRSLQVLVSDEAESKYIRYPLFKTTDRAKYRSFLLRNSGNDWYKTRIKDILNSSLLDVNYLSVNIQRFEPVVVYINKKYWGQYNMREKINPHYLEYNYDVKDKNVEMIEKHHISIKGNKENFKRLMDYITKESFTSKKKLDSLNRLLDLNNYIDYQAIQIYTGNKDWPQNNVKCWRESTKYYSGKWHYILYDLDESFLDPKFPSITVALGKDTARITQFDSLYKRATLILPKLITNRKIKSRLVNRIFDLMNFTYSESRVNSKIDSIVKLVDGETKRTLDLWYPQYSFFQQMKNNDYYKYWKSGIEGLRSYIPRRNESLLKQLKEHKWITNSFDLSIKYDSKSFQVRINGIPYTSKKPVKYSTNFGCLIEIKSIDGSKPKIPTGWTKVKENTYRTYKGGEVELQ